MVVPSQPAVNSDAHAWAAFADEAAGALARFEHSLQQPEVAQTAAFREVVAYGANTAFGRAHGFPDIRTVQQFRDRVPVSRWPDYAPWIERAQRESDRDRSLAPTHESDRM